MERIREQTKREEINKGLMSTFMPIVGAALAHRPRPLRHTLDTAAAYGMDAVKEAEYLWLADLALSLPLPAG